MAKNKLTDEQMKQLINDLKREKPTNQELEPATVATDMVQASGSYSRMQEQQALAEPATKNDQELMLTDHRQATCAITKLKQKLSVAVILSIPIIGLSKPLGMTLPLTINIPYQAWIVLTLSTIIFLYGGLPFIIGAWRELKSKMPSTMVLTTFGLTLTYVYSIYATIINYLHSSNLINPYFWGLVVLIDIILLGQIIEKKAFLKVGATTDKLANLLPKEAQQLKKLGETKPIAVTDLELGDQLMIAKGAVIPADGVIVAGETTTNEAMLTGEATQVIKQIDDEVLGGSINGEGVITIQVTHLGTDSFLVRVQAMVMQTQAQKNTTQTGATKIERRLFYLTLLMALVVLVFWTMFIGFDEALPLVVTVLVIACPHVLKLPIPLAVDRLMALTAQRGLLIQNIEPLEHADKLKYALMDKTGTLTEGNFKIRTLKSISAEYSDSDILAIMATLEDGSNHPLAQGIIAMAKNKKIGLMNGSEIENRPGIGVTGVINNQRFALVAIDYLVEHAIAFDQNYFDKLADAGNSVSFLVTTDKVVGLVAQGDVIKASAIKFIRELKKRGITPVMLTGDNPVMAQRVAKSLAISDVKAQLKPDQKAQLVREYQKKGPVMMIGDGVNDSPALAQAELGIAIGAGPDIAIKAADVVIVKTNPTDILKLLALVNTTNAKIKRNLWWIIAYNVAAIILAAGIMIPLGLTLNPMLGVIFATIVTVMATSTGARVGRKENQ